MDSDRTSTEIEIVIRTTERDGSTSEMRFAEEVVSADDMSYEQIGEHVYGLGATAAGHFGYVR